MTLAKLGDLIGGHQPGERASAIACPRGTRVRVVPKRLVGRLVAGLLRPLHPRRPTAHRTLAGLEGEEVRPILGQRDVEPAGAHAALVLAEGNHAVALVVIPLGLSNDQRVASQLALCVVVLVALLGLPPQKPALGDAERSSEGQSVALVSSADEVLDNFGTEILASCSETT